MYIELWKWIAGYEGLYMVSTHGRVKSVDRYERCCKDARRLRKSKILKQATDKDGYKRVRLYKNGKYKVYSVHRLVAQAFLDNPNNYPIINHKDEDKANNYYKNLEWCTQQYNTKYSSYKWTGENSYWYGKHHTEESKRKISNSKRKAN